MPFSFTPLMRKRLTRRVCRMLERSLLRFPELRGKTITVGYTQANFGSASWDSRAHSEPRLTIRLKVRKLCYQTIGHELTHLVQGLGRWRVTRSHASGKASIPAGEKACDIWTLARSRLFCDEAPTYLRLPRAVRGDWPSYAESVHKLCIAAIKKRKTHRPYIRWLEGQIRELARRPAPPQTHAGQLTLPLDR